MLCSNIFTLSGLLLGALAAGTSVYVCLVLIPVSARKLMLMAGI